MPLTDDSGSRVVATIADGSEIEVLGWRPRHGARRYRIVGTDGGPEGWVGASSLRPREVAAPPTPVEKPARRKTAVAPGRADGKRATARRR